LSPAVQAETKAPFAAMPDKPLTIATYAAGASLAAITLVYVFGPTFFLDGEGSPGLKPSTRRPVVGLFNPANGMLVYPCMLDSMAIANAHTVA
jgi:hypothetical protein